MPHPPTPRLRHASAALARVPLAGAAAAGLLLALTVVVPGGVAAATAPLVRYSATDVVAGTRVTTTVKDGTAPAGTRLVLQREYPDGWRAADNTAKKTAKGWRFRVPSDQFGTFAYRVA